MNEIKKNLFFALAPLLLSLVILSQQQGITQEEVDDNGSQVTGNVVNSIYLLITDHSYSKISDQITGTIINNSTQEIEFPMIYAALYNADNQLITIEGGSAYVDLLPAGNNSVFDVPIFGSEGEVDHYTLYPSGTPTQPYDDFSIAPEQQQLVAPEGGEPPGAIPGPILPQ